MQNYEEKFQKYKQKSVKLIVEETDDLISKEIKARNKLIGIHFDLYIFCSKIRKFHNNTLFSCLIF